MKIPVLPAVVLLSLLALHSAQGASLASSEVSTSPGFSFSYLLPCLILHFFTFNALLNMWLLFLESIKRKLPFLNWDAFPKLKGLRSATPDAQ
uniref:Keratinocyte differentiation associated protein n=1 Tax=Ursus americanus TaxID=9643 RepID=A0A452S428_URSAM